MLKSNSARGKCFDFLWESLYFQSESYDSQNEAESLVYVYPWFMFSDFYTFSPGLGLSKRSGFLSMNKYSLPKNIVIEEIPGLSLWLLKNILPPIARTFNWCQISNVNHSVVLKTQSTISNSC